MKKSTQVHNVSKFIKSVTLLSTFTFITFNCFAQTADEIINKNITAMGGLEKLNSIKSLYTEDSLFAGPAKIPFKQWQVNKKAMRAEFSYNGMTGFAIIRNDSGWNYVPFQGQQAPEPITGDEVKKAQQELYINDAFVNYKEKGYKVTFEGKDEAEGSEAYKIKVTVTDSISETYFIDPDTYYVIQKKTKATVNGKSIESSETYSDYKKNAEGYVFPMETSSTDQGEQKTYVIKVNQPIDNSIFSPTVKVAGK